jgi:hypothetical protein
VVAVVEGTAWVAVVWKRVVAEGVTTECCSGGNCVGSFHTTDTHAVPSTTETPEHHFSLMLYILLLLKMGTYARNM